MEYIWDIFSQFWRKPPARGDLISFTMKTSQIFVPEAKNDETVVTEVECPKCAGAGVLPVVGCCPVCRGRKTRFVLATGTTSKSP